MRVPGVVGFRVVGVAHREVGPSAGFSVCTGKYSLRRFPPMALSQSVVSELGRRGRSSAVAQAARASLRWLPLDHPVSSFGRVQSDRACQPCSTSAAR